MQELKDIQNYLNQFGLIAWIDRNLYEVSDAANQDIRPKAAMESDQTTTTIQAKKARSFSASVTASVPPAASVTAPVPPAASVTAPVPPAASVTAPVPPAASVTAPVLPAASITAPVPPAASITAPVSATQNTGYMIGVLDYGDVLVVYSLDRREGLDQTERELLNNMLKKCGMVMNNKLYIKERILRYPPVMESIAKKMPENSWQNTYKGFFTALLDNDSRAEIIYILLLGEATASILPQLTKDTMDLLAKHGGKCESIVIDDTGTMLNNPSTRKKTWDSLAPLREHLSKSN